MFIVTLTVLIGIEYLYFLKKVKPGKLLKISKI